MIALTTNILLIGTGCQQKVAELWLPHLQRACSKFAIDTDRRIAAFLVNVGVESEGLTSLEEHLNYSAKRLAEVWPSRYADKYTKLPNATATRLQGRPVELANNVYANRLGNGDESSGDGWRYRGQGPIQTTGKTNILAACRACGIDFDANPAALRQPAGGSLVAAYFFNQNCLKAADDGNFDLVVKIINGSPPSKINRGDLRLDRYNAVMRELRA
jgi:putative chitinase